MRKCTRQKSSSNWILMSCQPHRVTSGQSNSGHKQIHSSKLFSHIYQPSVKSIYKTNHFANIKHTYTNIEELVPSVLPLLKEHIRLGHAGIVERNRNNNKQQQQKCSRNHKQNHHRYHHHFCKHRKKLRTNKQTNIQLFSLPMNE